MGAESQAQVLYQNSKYITTELSISPALPVSFCLHVILSSDYAS